VHRGVVCDGLSCGIRLCFICIQFGRLWPPRALGSDSDSDYGSVFGFGFVWFCGVGFALGLKYGEVEAILGVGDLGAQYVYLLFVFIDFQVKTLLRSVNCRIWMTSMQAGKYA